MLYIKAQELLYIRALKQEGLAQEWHSNLGLVKEAGDVGLYLHPAKPAEPARKPMTEEEILVAARDHYNPYQRAEISFARAVEKHHGIGGDDD